MLLSRRMLLAGLGATSVVGVPAQMAAASQLTFGDMRVSSVSDGNLVLPTAFFFDRLPQDEVTEILERHDMPTDQLTPPCNVTVLQHEDRTVLFDAGSGPGFMPSAGALLGNLEGLGIAPEDVTHVVFTHGHPDHLWGVLDDFDDPVFPDAAHLIGQLEWDYWRDPETVGTIGDARASMAVGTARRLEAIEEHCDFFTAGQEILPGIMAHESFGHTPGHMSFELRSGSQSVLVGGDAIGNHHVAFERPDWDSGADQDKETGAKTRHRLLDQLAQDQMTLIGFHLPDGGIGRVERKDSAYRFVTEDM